MANSKKINLIIILIYFTLAFGFFYGEDSIGGAFNDYNSHAHIAEKFKSNFFYTLLNYNDLSHRHSPIFYILKSIFLNFGELGQKILFLHLFLLIPIFFYKSLKIVFNQAPKINLKLLSTIILLFPTFRSYSIWSDPHLLGTLFFIISVYYYLKFKKNKNPFQNSLINTFFLSLSAYCSPNFGMFAIFFFINYCLKFKISKEILIISIFNILLSIPFFYYLFILEVNFLFNISGWDIGENLYNIANISNKIIIIISLLFFYLLPFILSKNLNYNFRNIIKIKNEFIVYLILFFIMCYFFDFSDTYNLTNSGGGFIYNLSQIIFKNNLILFVICFFTYIYLVQIFKANKNNILLFIILILSHPQNTIWQANFSPTIYFLILLLFNLELKKDAIKIRTIYLNYIYFSLYLLLSITYKILIN